MVGRNIDFQNGLLDMTRKRKKRILIVDDSPVVLAALKEDFANDYEVILAGSGEEAIEILEDPVREGVCFGNQFDLIISDLVMPRMDGFAFAEYVRKRNKVNKYTPVIILSNQKISKEDARASGCVAYFCKSDKQRLLSIVRILLSL